MWKALTTAIAAALIFTSAHAAEITPAEMAITLDKSVALLNLGGGYCTATKIAPRQWLTARHCITSSMKIETEKTYLYPRSVLMTVEDKTEGSRNEDWAIVNTADEDESVPSLPLGCNDTVYAGMPVAYLGYPADVDRAFVMGHVSSMKRARNYVNDADWVMNMVVAGGASGSALVSMDTGNIIGIVTEGLSSPRTGFFMTGIESVRNLDWCQDYNENLQYQEEDGGIDLDQPDTVS